MKAHFHDLLKYNQHFNHLLIENFFTNSSFWCEKSKHILNHILNAHQIWNARILNEDKFEVWQINPDQLLVNINSANLADSIKILEERELSEIISYNNSKGASFENSIKEIFFHLVNHSTYHRGQIAMLMRQAGLEPINTDYIFYKRL